MSKTYSRSKFSVPQDTLSTVINSNNPTPILSQDNYQNILLTKKFNNKEILEIKQEIQFLTLEEVIEKTKKAYLDLPLEFDLQKQILVDKLQDLILVIKQSN